MSVMKMMVAVAAVTSVALVGCGRGHGEMTQERLNKMVSWKVDDFLDSVDATDAQRDHVNAIATRMANDVGPVLLDNAESRAALQKLFESQTVDAASVHATLDKRSDALKGVAHKVADAAIEVREVLTPAQRQQVVAKLQAYEHRYHRQ